MPEFHTNAEDALKILTSNYANLSRYAQQIMELKKAAPATPLRCDLIDAYHRAVKEYLSFGNKIFQLLDKNKMQIDQVVYKDGKPQVDAQGNVRMLRLSAPLRPPTFVLNDTFCPNITRVGASYPRNEIGALFLAAIPLAKLAIMAIGGIVITGVGGYYAVEGLRQIRLTFTNAPDLNFATQVSQWSKCADHAKKELGMSSEQILKACGPEGAMKVPPGGSSNWGPIFLGVAAIGGGVLFLTRKGA